MKRTEIKFITAAAVAVLAALLAAFLAQAMIMLTTDDDISPFYLCLWAVMGTAAALNLTHSCLKSGVYSVKWVFFAMFLLLDAATAALLIRIFSRMTAGWELCLVALPPALGLASTLAAAPYYAKRADEKETDGERRIWLDLAIALGAGLAALGTFFIGGAVMAVLHCAIAAGLVLRHVILIIK